MAIRTTILRLILLAAFSIVFCDADCVSNSKTVFCFIPDDVTSCKGSNLGADDDTQLEDYQKSVQENLASNHFSFESFKFAAFKGDSFESIDGGLKSLILNNMQVDLLLEPYYANENNTKTWKGLNELTTLVIVNNENAYGWKFDELYDSNTGLTNLKNIYMKNNKLYYVNNELLDLAANPRYISIEYCEVYWTEPIINTKELEWLSLSHNNLEEIPNKFIAQDADLLWYLDLSHNQLTQIPDDLTETTPKLRELNLSHNQLLIVSQKILAPVWKTLDALWINDNILDFSEDQEEELCWYRNKVIEKNFFVKPMFWYTAVIQIPYKGKITISNLGEKLNSDICPTS